MNYDTENYLRSIAHHLSMAQHCGIKDGYSWADAYNELTRVLGTEEAFVSFEPVEHLNHLTADQLFTRVGIEADAIENELHTAYKLGFNEGANK